MHIEVTVSNTDDDRVIRYAADFTDVEIFESHMTGELSVRPGHLADKARGMPKSMSPWQQFLEGDWEVSA